MVGNFEFLGNEPIENVITCMNFFVDKVVFFGYQEVIDNQRENAESFLKKYCGVKSVVFHSMSHNNLQSVIKTMRNEIEYEKSQDADVYFDITGGESLILVAFGMLSKEFDTPMHIYDIPSGELIELDEGSKNSISSRVEVNSVKMSLDRLIEMRGGTINYKMHKDIKTLDEDFLEDIEKLWQVVKEYSEYWNPFSEFLRIYMVPDENLKVNKSANEVIKSIAKSHNILRSIKKLNEIIDKLGAVGVIKDIVHSDGTYRFTFKNEKIMGCILEGGSVLELHTYLNELNNCDECQVGVHIDWDGIVHNEPGQDVLNEIDVLSLNGYVPTFISCKSGKMGSQQILHALYELDTVTKKFGGKYAEKVLVTAKDISKVYIERAKEMGIEVR